MNRDLTAHTSQGSTWWAVSLNGQEALSELYEFCLGLKSEDANIDCQSLLGETAAVELSSAQSGQARYFSGQIVKVAARGMRGRHWYYEATLAPKLWYASCRADFRIFQNQTVHDIADQILQQNAINYEWRLKNSYKTWEYVVQYGETDLAFLLRLLGHEGIYFWFEHTEKGEILILGDHFTIHKPFPGYETVPYYPSNAQRPDDYFHVWHASRMPGPGKFVQTSYDFKQPSKDLKTEFNDPRGHLFDQYEIFAYPGAYTEPGHGQEYAAALLQGLQVNQDTIVLEGPVCGVVPGCSFKLQKHPVEEQNREYLITNAEYRAQNNDYESGEGAQSEEAYFHAKVTAIPADRQYRTPREKFKMPRAHGPDTAVVVGPPGTEIHDDEYGRIKVHFHWDRYGKRDGSDSCWIRVASPWGGADTGAVSIPRVGQEVVVSYEHGDPQRPQITGCVFNAQQMQMWGAPASKTQSGLMNRSTPGGGADNYNAIILESAIGQEEMRLQAERDLNSSVKNDETHSVDHDRTKNVGNNETASVGNDQTTSVGNNQTESVGNDQTMSVGSNQTASIGNDRTMDVTAKLTETIGQGQEVTIGAGGYMETITGGSTSDITGELSIGATEAISLQSSSATIDIHANGAGSYTSDEQLSFGVGKSSGIGITPADIGLGVGGDGGAGIGITAADIGLGVGGGSGAGIGITAADIGLGVGGDGGAGIGITAADIGIGVGDESGITVTAGEITISSNGSTIKLDTSGVFINGKKVELN